MSIDELEKWLAEVEVNTPEYSRRAEVLYQAVLAERRKSDPNFTPRTGMQIARDA
jgi:hypothetical protein